MHDLPLAAQVRVEPALADLPVAVLDVAQDPSRAGALPPGHGTATVIACTASARALGVLSGQTGHHARAVAPDLRFRGRSADLEARARDALFDAASGLAARVAPAPDGVFLDAAELSALHASEAALGAALAAAAQRVGLPVRVGIAGSLEVAAVVARSPGVTVVLPGEERRHLARLPLEALDLSDELRGDLRRFGVTRVSELAALPLDATGLRLGDEGAQAVRLARGEGSTVLLPQAPPVRIEEGVDLEWEVDTLEPLFFVLRRLLDALLARLVCRNLAFGGLQLAFALASGRREERTLPLAVPTRDVPSLFGLLRAALEKQPPPAAVRSLRIAALPRAPRTTQLGLFDPPGPAPERLALTLTRLAALAGEGNVGSPAAADGHRPHAVEVHAYAPPRTPREPPSVPRPLALHVLRPPRELVVAVGADGRPAAVHATGLRGRVRACGGPWRAEGAWWGEAFTHDGWDVALDDGGLYLLAHDPVADRWWLDGIWE